MITLIRLLLACTHYPLIKKRIEKFLPKDITVIAQGEIVAASLEDYLHRHTEVEMQLSKNKSIQFYTTDSAEDFNNHASIFYDEEVEAIHTWNYKLRCSYFFLPTCFF